MEASSAVIESSWRWRRSEYGPCQAGGVHVLSAWQPDYQLSPAFMSHTRCTLKIILTIAKSATSLVSDSVWQIQAAGLRKITGDSRFVSASARQKAKMPSKAAIPEQRRPHIPTPRGEERTKPETWSTWNAGQSQHRSHTAARINGEESQSIFSKSSAHIQAHNADTSHTITQFLGLLCSHRHSLRYCFLYIFLASCERGREN